MSAAKKIRSKRKVKRAGVKALRSPAPPNTYPRKDGKQAATAADRAAIQSAVDSMEGASFRTAFQAERYLRKDGKHAK